MEKYYKELINLADNKKCIEANVVSELHEKYAALEEETIDTLKDNLSNYTSFIYRTDPIIRAECPAK